DSTASLVTFSVDVLSHLLSRQRPLPYTAGWDHRHHGGNGSRRTCQIPRARQGEVSRTARARSGATGATTRTGGTGREQALAFAACDICRRATSDRRIRPHARLPR